MVFYKKRTELSLNFLYKSEHFCLHEVKLNGQIAFCLANIYFPCDDRSTESLVDYQTVLGELQSALENTDVNKFLAVGDFNADPRKGRFWNYLEDFSSYNNFIFPDLKLPNDTFTFLSAAHNTCSWLDHVLATQNILIDKVTVLYDKAVYDHFPIYLEVEVLMNYINEEQNADVPNDLTEELINWKIFDDQASSNYNFIFGETMQEFVTDHEVFNEPVSTDIIDLFYDKLVDGMKLASERYRFKNKKVFRPVPGWNEFCKEKYNAARTAFLLWVQGGKIRLGSLYDDMISTRKLFRSSLKYCQSRSQQIRDDQLIKAYKDKNCVGFWKEVSNRRNKQSLKSVEIDGFRDDGQISELFKTKFSSITGSTNGNHEEYSHSFNSQMQCSSLISKPSLESIVKNLKPALGFDGIHASHIKHLDSHNLFYVLKFLNICLTAAYVPRKMLRGVIRPIPKDRFGDIGSSDNYREIMISSVMFKLLEYCILPVIKENINLSTCQFGYREQTSTMLAVTLLKETIRSYIDESSSVYACFLDMSKAFERINHEILLAKMQSKGLPPFVIGLFRCIFGTSEICVNYKGSFSGHWTATKGVRQGGVTSAYLFCLYIDDILMSINELPYGCWSGLQRINVQAYADDIVIFCPSVLGLKRLFYELERQLVSNDFVINFQKTKTMIFSRKAVIFQGPVLHVNGIDITNVKEYKYLGCMLDCKLNEKSELNRITGAFNRMVGMFIRKFATVELGLKVKLFNILCLSFYGLELVLDQRGCSSAVRKLAVSYHYALKRLIGFPKYFSNHYTCNALNMLTFQHLMNYRLFRYYKWLSETKSPCFIAHKCALVHFSVLSQKVRRIFSSSYGVCNLLENDTDAIAARIGYVQLREPSSLYMFVR